MLIHIRPFHDWFTVGSPNVPPHRVLALCLAVVRIQLTPSAESSFAPIGCYPQGGDIYYHLEKRYLFFIAHTNSCARPNSSQWLRSTYSTKSLQVVISSCWKLVLPGVISANLSLDAWIPTPVVFTVHLIVSSCKSSAFPANGPGWLTTTLLTITSVRVIFRSCNHSLMFRPPVLLATLVIPTTRSLCNLQQQWLLHPSRTRIVTFASIRYASCPKPIN